MRRLLKFESHKKRQVFITSNRWLSTLNLKSGYWQVKIDSADKKKTIFTLRCELTLLVQCYAIWPLQCSSDFREAYKTGTTRFNLKNLFSLPIQRLSHGSNVWQTFEKLPKNVLTDPEKQIKLNHKKCFNLRKKSLVS